MDFSGPIDHDALLEAKVFYGLLPVLSAGFINRIYEHWSVEQWGCVDGAYNAVVDLRDGKWRILVSHDIQTNAVGDQNTEAAHTYHRNSHAFGIAINGLVGAGVHDFGADPVYLRELETLTAGVGAIALKYNVDIGGMVNGEHTVMTHAEAAILDSYFPGDGDPDSRWDLSIFEALPAGVDLTKDMARASGQKLRDRARQYKIALQQMIGGS